MGYPAPSRSGTDRRDYEKGSSQRSAKKEAPQAGIAPAANSIAESAQSLAAFAPLAKPPHPRRMNDSPELLALRVIGFMLTALGAVMLAVTLGRLWKRLASIFGIHPITPLMAKARKVGWAWIG